MTFKQKVRNIWDYDKWYILGGIAIIVLAVMFFKDILFKKSPDIQIVSVAYGYLSKEQVEAVESTLAAFAEDTDGDGETTVNLLNIEFSVGGAAPQLDRNANTQLMAETSMQENCLFLINKTHFDKIWKEDYSTLTDLSSISDLPEETYFLPISKTALKDSLPFLDEDLLLIVRIPYDKDHTKDYESALKFAENLLNS